MDLEQKRAQDQEQEQEEKQTTKDDPYPGDSPEKELQLTSTWNLLEAWGRVQDPGAKA